MKFVLLCLVAIIIATCSASVLHQIATTNNVATLSSSTDEMTVQNVATFSSSTDEMTVQDDGSDWVELVSIEEPSDQPWSSDSGMIFGHGQKYGTINFRYYPTRITTSRLIFWIEILTPSTSSSGNSVSLLKTGKHYATVNGSGSQLINFKLEFNAGFWDSLITYEKGVVALFYEITEGSAPRTRYTWPTSTKYVHSLAKYEWFKASSECTTPAVCGTYTKQASAECLISQPYRFRSDTSNYDNASATLKNILCPNAEKPSHTTIVCETTEICENGGTCSSCGIDQPNYCECIDDFGGPNCTWGGAEKNKCPRDDREEKSSAISTAATAFVGLVALIAMLF